MRPGTNPPLGARVPRQPSPLAGEGRVEGTFQVRRKPPSITITLPVM